jgi:membrane protease YdiL (CAAX protease family)
MMDAYLEFAARGKNAWWRYLLTLLLCAVLVVAAVKLLALGLQFAHLMPPDIAAQIQQPKDFLSFYVEIGVIFGLFAACLAAAAFLVQRKRPSDIIGRWRTKLFVAGLLIWFCVQTLLALIDFAMAPGGFSVSFNSATLPMAGMALAGILVQTFTEEFLFRGFATQGLLLAIKKPLPTAIVSGLLFGSMHIPNGLPQALSAAMFGIVCALIVIRTGGIALTFGMHLANNYFGAVIVVSGGDVFRGSPGFFTQATPQLTWWDLGLAVLAFAGMGWLVFRRSYFSAAPAS